MNDENATVENAAETPAEPTMDDKISSEIGEWMADHIHGSAIAQHTAAFNHLTQSLDALKARILALFPKE